MNSRREKGMRLGEDFLASNWRVEIGIKSSVNSKSYPESLVCYLRVET
jgi:hypothetical protein